MYVSNINGLNDITTSIKNTNMPLWLTLFLEYPSYTIQTHASFDQEFKVKQLLKFVIQ